MAGDRPPMPVRIESPSGARPESFLGKPAGTESFEGLAGYKINGLVTNPFPGVLGASPCIPIGLRIGEARVQRYKPSAYEGIGTYFPCGVFFDFFRPFP